MKKTSLKTTDISFTRVTEFFVEEIRKGNAPSVDVFARAFPHLADEIVCELPAIEMIERAAGLKRVRNQPSAPGNSQLGGCVIQEEIGRGGMGVVYRAFQTDLNRTVAVKVLKLFGTDSSLIAGRFELERHAMARLDHPNIVPVYSYGHNEDVAYLIMKCIDGHSLLDLQEGAGDHHFQVALSMWRSDWNAVAKLAIDIASGLQHSHDHGLVHRDIKPGNLLIDKQGKVWISDYGLAKIHDYARSLSGTGDAIGTPRYMAPEQIRGICDPRSDIYSLGITLYELVANKKAWEEATYTTLMSKRASLELPDVRSQNPDVPDALAKIIMKACAFSPEDRYQTCKELGIVLQRFCAGMSPSDRRKRRREPDEVFRRKSQRNIVVAIAATVSVLLTSFALIHSIRAKSNQVVQDPVAVPKARLASTNLIEKLAEEKDLGKAVHEFFQQSIKEAGDEFHLADQEKKEILNQWNDVTLKLKEAKMDSQSIKQFEQGFRESTIPLGTKIISLGRILDRSSLHTSQKEQAYELLRRFAKAVIHRSIPEDEANMLLLRLTGGRMLSTEEMQTIQLPDQHLHSWLSLIAQRLQSVPASTLDQLDVRTELDRMIQGALPPPNPNIPR